LPCLRQVLPSVIWSSFPQSGRKRQNIKPLDQAHIDCALRGRQRGVCRLCALREYETHIPTPRCAPTRKIRRFRIFDVVGKIDNLAPHLKVRTMKVASRNICNQRQAPRVYSMTLRRRLGKSSNRRRRIFCRSIKRWYPPPGFSIVQYIKIRVFLF